MIGGNGTGSVNVPMVKLSPSLNLVGIVNAENSLPVRIMERGAVFKSARAVSACHRLMDFVFHAIALGEFKFLTVKAQEQFHFVIRLLRYLAAVAFR